MTGGLLLLFSGIFVAYIATAGGKDNSHDCRGVGGDGGCLGCEDRGEGVMYQRGPQEGAFETGRGGLEEAGGSIYHMVWVFQPGYHTADHQVTRARGIQ